MKHVSFFFLVLFFVLSIAMDLGAQSVWQARCGGRIIKPGLSKQFLINNCREPDHTENFTRGSSGRRANMEKLYYYVEKHTYIVTVRDGIIESINVEPR